MAKTPNDTLKPTIMLVLVLSLLLGADTLPVELGKSHVMVGLFVGGGVGGAGAGGDQYVVPGPL